MLIANEWKDYELIVTSNGEKLERWGKYKLLRPDPQIIWNNGNLSKKYNDIDAVYHRSNTGGGNWENIKKVSPFWQISYKNLTFNISQVFPIINIAIFIFSEFGQYLIYFLISYFRFKNFHLMS